MILTPHQLELQEAILKRLYPWVSMEEAKKKESKHNDTLIILDNNLVRIWDTISFECKENEWLPVMYMVKLDKVYLLPTKNIIGLPPTLPRILTALGDDYYYNMYELKRRVPLFWIDTDIPRILLNEDMTDKNLWEQEQETQDILYSIFCK